jgi:hypothetical protein
MRHLRSDYLSQVKTAGLRLSNSAQVRGRRKYGVPRTAVRCDSIADTSGVRELLNSRTFIVEQGVCMARIARE